MVPLLINKDMFEPIYNDLKVMFWNHNYICTNLIESDISISNGFTELCPGDFGILIIDVANISIKVGKMLVAQLCLTLQPHGM